MKAESILKFGCQDFSRKISPEFRHYAHPFNSISLSINGRGGPRCRFIIWISKDDTNESPAWGLSNGDLINVSLSFPDLLVRDLNFCTFDVCKSLFFTTFSFALSIIIACSPIFRGEYLYLGVLIPT